MTEPFQAWREGGLRGGALLWGGTCWLWPWVCGQEEGPPGDGSKDRARWGSVSAEVRPRPSPTGPQLSVKLAPTENPVHGVRLVSLLERCLPSLLPQDNNTFGAEGP